MFTEPAVFYFRRQTSLEKKVQHAGLGGAVVKTSSLVDEVPGLSLTSSLCCHCVYVGGGRPFR